MTQIFFQNLQKRFSKEDGYEVELVPDQNNSDELPRPPVNDSATAHENTPNIIDSQNDKNSEKTVSIREEISQENCLVPSIDENSVQNQSNEKIGPTRPKQLSLNSQFSSNSNYPIPSSIRLQCANDEFEERKNAEKRVHLYERRK